LAIGLDSWGIKLSLFDVSDDNNPRAIEEIVEGNSDATSEALTEHRAFRYIDDKNLLMVPIVSSFDNGLFIYGVDLDSGFSSMGAISHAALVDDGGSGDASTVRRAYRIGENVYSYSAAGVSITNLATLKDVAQINLPDVR